MKKKILVFVLGLSILALAGIVYLAIGRDPQGVKSGDDAQSQAAEGSQSTYTHPELGLTFKYPTSWGEVQPKTIKRVQPAGKPVSQQLINTTDIIYLSFKNKPPVSAFFSDANARTDLASAGVTNVPNNEIYLPSGFVYDEAAKTVCFRTSFDTSCKEYSLETDGEENVKIHKVDGLVIPLVLATPEEGTSRFGDAYGRFFQQLFPEQVAVKGYVTEFAVQYGAAGTPHNMFYFSYRTPDADEANSVVERVAKSIQTTSND